MAQATPLQGAFGHFTAVFASFGLSVLLDFGRLGKWKPYLGDELGRSGAPTSFPLPLKMIPGLPEDKPLPTNHNVVGVDLGLTTFAYFSNGQTIERQRWMKQDAADIARLQRKKEKFAKGSPERRKMVHALCHAYERAANRRNNFAHQESRKLVNEYQFIAFEKLDSNDMQSNGTTISLLNFTGVANSAQD